MNKKLATLMFAIGLGAAAAPAFATSCEAQCGRNFGQCLANPLYDAEFCNQRYEDCLTICS